VRSSHKRADVIIVTKCPAELDQSKKDHALEELKADSHQSVFFSSIVYDVPYHLFSNREKNFDHQQNILLICGIANPAPVVDELSRRGNLINTLLYSDHHIFSIDDLRDIIKTYEKLKADNLTIITTEKDGVRLAKFQNELKDLPIYVLPIKHHILFGEAEQLNKKICSFVEGFYNREVQS
jgi:tetraacyldisaccharide 4'-kinase